MSSDPRAIDLACFASLNLAALGLPALWERFKEATGETTKSPNKKFLVRRIEEALAARAVGPAPAEAPSRPMHTSARVTPAPSRRRRSSRARRRSRAGRFASMKILPLRLEADVADKMDEAWHAKGIKNRMEFLRGAIGYYLAHLGARDAAALFTEVSAPGR